MSSWLKIKGTQTGELGLGFTGPVLKNDSGNLILRDAANVANVSLTAANITASGVFYGNGSGLTSLTGANVTGQVGNAQVAGTVYEAAQPNITSVGTLTNLAVSGNATVGGNLIVNGNLVYVNVETLAVEDPIIELGGGPNNAPLTTNDGKDRGTLLHYYTTAPVDAFMGWDNSNAEFTFGSNVTVTNDIVTYNTLGNVRAGFYIGDGSLLANINGANVSNVATANYANFAGTAFNVSGSNVSGQVANALVAGTVYTNAQPNVTSLGTLANLNVNGPANLGAVGNVVITGGSAGFILSTDGLGNLTFVAPISGASAWKVDSTTIAFGASATTTAMTLPANAIVDKVSVIIDTPFNGTAPTMSVGLQGGTGFEYAAVGDINLKVGDRYDMPSQLAAVGTSQVIDILYTADGSSAGSARVLITYAIPE